MRSRSSSISSASRRSEAPLFVSRESYLVSECRIEGRRRRPIHILRATNDEIRATFPELGFSCVCVGNLKAGRRDVFAAAAGTAPGSGETGARLKFEPAGGATRGFDQKGGFRGASQRADDVRQMGFHLSLGNVERLGQLPGGPAPLAQETKESLALGHGVGHKGRDTRIVQARNNGMIADMKRKIISVGWRAAAQGENR